MKDKSELTIVIKNIPSEPLNLIWKDVLQSIMSQFNEVAEPTNHVIVDFDEIFDMEHFYQAVGFAMTQHCMTTAIKIKGIA